MCRDARLMIHRFHTTSLPSEANQTLAANYLNSGWRKFGSSWFLSFVEKCQICAGKAVSYAHTLLFLPPIACFVAKRQESFSSFSFVETSAWFWHYCTQMQGISCNILLASLVSQPCSSVVMKQSPFSKYTSMYI